MFVLKSTYKRVVEDRDFFKEGYHRVTRALNSTVSTLEEYSRYADSLKDHIHELEYQIEANTYSEPRFTEEDLKRLIVLCHPDKHDGKQMAVEMTDKLLKMRGK